MSGLAGRHVAFLWNVSQSIAAVRTPPVPMTNDKNPWQLFDDYIPAANQFADPGPISPRAEVDLTIDPTEWRTEVDAIEHRWQAIVQPTYAVQAIKESAIVGGPKPRGAETAGAEWGQVLHTLLEAAINQPKVDLQSLALSALEIEELPVSLLDDVLATIERVTVSEIWKRAQNAKRCLPEVPIAMLVAVSETGNGLPTVRRGVIDPRV